MKCESVQQDIVLATYGELPDERIATLEQHLAQCEACNRELKALLAMHDALAYQPILEPSPNLVAQSRMRLDEELDTIPPHGLLTRLRSGLFSWLGHMQSAPALATLLVGGGFLAGNFINRYQVAHQPRLPQTVVMTNPANSCLLYTSSRVTRSSCPYTAASCSIRYPTVATPAAIASGFPLSVPA